MVVKPPKPRDPDSSMSGLPSMPSLPSMPTPSIPSTSTGIYKNKHPPINLNPPIPPIKKIEDKTKVNVRYPLISPYAYAHIYWNAKSSELVYDIEEPILNEQEKKLLRIIKNALQEIINISYLGEQSQEQILEYIAKAINLIAEELSLKIPESTYNKLFYYVYRDFIGLNEIEPLMRDYFIEDIECNGINSSVYVVHRLYRNIRTNLIFYSIDYLASLVEKLAQRCGKYISYANPLLDGSLPDGSRVNATYTTEITTRGPTFCFKDGYVQLNDGRVKNIKELFEEAKKNFPTKIEGGNEIVEVANVGCCGVDEKSLEQVDARIKSIIKLKPPEKLVKISFSDGGEIEVTLNHLFHVADDCLKLIEAKDLKPGMFVPMPKKINVRGYRQKIDVYSLIKDFSYFKKVCVVANPSIKQLIASIISQTGNYRQVLAQRYGVGSSYFYEIISRGNSIAFEILDRICVERNVDFSSFDEIAIVVYGGGTKNKAKAIKVPKEVDEDLGYLAGALISDGHLSKDFVDFCCYEKGFGEAVKERLLRKFGKFDSYYNGKRIYLCNSFVPFFFNRVFGIPIGKKTTIVKVPEVIFKSDDKVIASFIRGLFDGGGICHSGLSYKTYSKELAEGLTYLLARLGIYSYLRNRGKEYTVNIPSPYYAKYLELIGFNNKAKEAKLKSLVEKQNTSRMFRKHDRIPAKPLLNIIKKLGLSKYKLLKECGFSCDKLDYLSISRHFASKLLHKILKNKNAHKAKDDIEYVRWLIDSEQEFVRIDKVEIVENSEAVYDIELEPCRFFVAGNKPMNMFDTIRKFTKIPWSPTQLIGFKTVSPEMLAYFWLLLQYKANILITGGTGSGKTSMLNALAFFIPPEARVVSIEDSVLGDAEIIYKKDGIFHRSTIAELIDGLVKDKEKAENAEGIEIFAMDKDGKIKLFKPSCFLRHKVKKKILKIRLASGKEISVTADHSLFSLNEEGKIVPVAGKDLKVGSFVATPRLLPLEEKEVVFKISEYFDKLNCPDCFVIDASFVKDNRATLRRFLSKSGVRWCRQKGFVRASFFKALDGNLSNLNGKSIRSKYGTILPSEIAVDEDLAAFVGLWLADGSYDRNSVIISVVEEECRQIVRRVAERFGLKCKMHSDGISLVINSKLFKAFCQNVLGLKGDAYTKRLPEWVFNLSRKKLAALLRGYFSGDGWVRKFEVVVSSASLGLLRDIQTALLRFEIQLRIGKKLKDDTYQARISAGSLDKFLEIGFLQQKKNERLAMLKRKPHDVSDVIPLPKHFYSIIDKFVKQKKQTWRIKNYVGKQSSNIGRRTLQELIQFIPNNPHGALHSLATNDVFWDKVVDIKEKEHEGFVYDISVPGVENFICQNIIAHNTREINLPRENWLPSVARTGLGGAEEIDLFTLLRESFRQRPDYVIVGEVRGREAYVLFQGMASGHASLSTIHADSVDAVIKRLQTPPISLSPTLLNILDVIAIMQHATVKGQETRRLAKVVEIVNIAEDGTATVNVPFYWSPADDRFYSKKEIYVFNKISERYGLSKEYLMNEFRLRTQLLFSLYKKGIADFFKVQKIINQYYKTPAQVIKEYL